jgi:hypothetical protein
MYAKKMSLAEKIRSSSQAQNKQFVDATSDVGLLILGSLGKSLI